MQGSGGEAWVEFTVGINGRVEGLKLRSATQPEFGQSALAALETWRFQAALSEGRGVAVALLKKVEFVAMPLDAKIDPKDGWSVLVQAARAGSIDDPRGLDEKLTPLLRVPPVYPAALLAMGRPIGAAEIEFVIARDGRARLPRVASATHEEFGWAASTAVAQ